jgi:hypothetical protein
VGVTFSPSAVGAATGVLSIADDALTSPQITSLSGTGSAPVTLSPGSLRFSGVPVGSTSTPRTVTLTNQQGVALNIGSVVASAGFAVATSTCGASLAAGASCTVGITFTPVAAGAVVGTLTFIDDAPISSQLVTLSGTTGGND